ncbi:hypothetical protein [Nocardia jejuensis]|uniref:hypothetical protein n=1 Tax=Nocardia jejuensis TaxID=328049 RepID=UPI0008349119|nr:hypothetical protein [Nocardia jejuensis]
MFCVASLVPSPPALVPELGGAAGAAGDGEVAVLRTAVLTAAGELAEKASRWLVVGVDESTRRLGPETTGSFRGYGVDVRVGLSGGLGTEPDPSLPLPVLIAGWLRGRLAPGVSAEAQTIAADAPASACRALGASLRAELDADPAHCGVLVVGDGAATMSTAAPRYLDARAEGAQADIDRALSAGDRAALAALDSGLCAELDVAGRPAYQVLAGLFETDAADPKVETLYAAAPFGVAYHVSVWFPDEAERGERV